MNTTPPDSKILKNIRCLITDVDGVMTDGRLHISANGETHKSFHVQDGLGIKLLQESGIPVAVISGRQSAALDYRLRELGIKHFATGQHDKTKSFSDICQTLGVTANQVAYVGDDLNDLCLLKQVGLAISVPNGSPDVHTHCHWVTTRSGGHGALREVCDALLRAHGHTPANSREPA
jgi:3-deoxy-D-manno-octulosonate 8-phosphate phosphatase (KDO 8-P phosphatase)